MTQLLQLKRTCSYPPQENINNNNNTVNSNKSLPITPCRSVNNTSTNSDTVQLRQVYPLTEENLALHTKNYPPSKDARRINTLKYVNNQRPVIEMELQLGEQREQELSLLQDIHFSDPFGDQSLDKPKNKKWFNKLVHWIRSDSPESKEKKKRHLSWSAGTEKENHKVMDCHKRDSGISLFSTNRRTSLLSAIPIVRQPKFSPAQKSQHLNEFKAFPYPKMKKQIVDNNKDAPITTTIIDETNQQVQTTGV